MKPTHTSRLSLRLIFIVAALPTLFLSPAQASDSGHTSVFYAVFERDADGTVRPAYAGETERVSPLKEKSADRIAETLGNERGQRVRLMVTLRDGKGSVVFVDALRVDPFVRSESADHHGKMEGERFAASSVTFSVQVPMVPNGELTIDGAKSHTFSIASLLQMYPATSEAASKARVTRASRIENSDNRVDLVIIGDGYRADQESGFDADAAEAEAGLFGMFPYSWYSNLVNVHRVFVPSAEAGADHPPCAQHDPLAPSYVDTAFNATFCSGGAIVRRLVVSSSTVVSAVTAAVPEWDQILVMVNDSSWGGTGGTLSVTSTHPNFVELVNHEYGHAFTELADEYVDTAIGYPPCSEPFCEANVTRIDFIPSSHMDLKWWPWIDESTPLPTDPFDYPDEPGMFEGARYVMAPMYRSQANCAMRSAGFPFCAVCTQEYVRKLYEGGWGPYGGGEGINLIVPGSEAPPPGFVDVNSFEHPIWFGIAPLSINTIVDIKWFVDGVQTASGYPYFSYVPTPGQHQVEVRVTDTGYRGGVVLVHPEMVTPAMTSTREWTINWTTDLVPPPRPELEIVPAADGNSMFLQWQPVTDTFSGTSHYEVFKYTLLVASLDHPASSYNIGNTTGIWSVYVHDVAGNSSFASVGVPDVDEDLLPDPLEEYCSQATVSATWDRAEVWAGANVELTLTITNTSPAGCIYDLSGDFDLTAVLNDLGVIDTWTETVSIPGGGVQSYTRSFTIPGSSPTGVLSISGSLARLPTPLTIDAEIVVVADEDGDGLFGANDNCTLVANPDQRDTNGDGYGNACDPDLDNDGTVNFVDLGLMKEVFFASGAGLDADFNGDGQINFVDLGTMKSFFFGAPGPSGIAP